MVYICIMSGLVVCLNCCILYAQFISNQTIFYIEYLYLATCIAVSFVGVVIAISDMMF